MDYKKRKKGKKKESKRKGNKQFHKDICKKMYDVIFSFCSHQWRTSNVSSFVYLFLRKVPGKWKEFGEEQQAQNTNKYNARAESENKCDCSSLQERNP